MLTDKERRARIDAMLAEEATRPLTWWWISFADDARFLGCTVVAAPGMATAIQRTHELGCNPGGSVAARQLLDIPLDIPPTDEILGRLSTDKDRVEALAAEWRSAVARRSVQS